MLALKNKTIRTQRKITFRSIDKLKQKELLCLYPDKEILIENCKYFNNEIIADLIPKNIEYALVNPNYYTAEQILKAISQLSYILVGSSILDTSITEFDTSLYNAYLIKLKSLECYFTEIDIQFKKKLYKNDLNRVSLRIIRVKQTSQFTIAKMEAIISNGLTANLTLIQV